MLIPGIAQPEVLARSARSTLLRGRRMSDGRSVIVKVLTEASPTAESLASVRATWALCRGLVHPGLVRTLDLIEVDRRPALVMEDIGGRALGPVTGPRPVEEVLAIGEAVARALAALHAKGVVHKDVQPANIVQSADGRVQLIDFDEATPLSREAARLLRPQEAIGRLRYMAPEQTGRMTLTVDGRADLYALGITLYELLSGAPPFTDAEPLALMHHHIAMTPAPLGGIVPGLLPGMEAVVMRLIEKSPDDRYQTAAGLAADLATLRAGQSLAVLGAQDHSDRLRPARRLYGREAEVEALSAAVGRVAGGAVELVLVSGAPGIGKSSLVHSVHRPTAAASGRYTEGKFDQLVNRPFSALVQVLRGLADQLAAEPVDDLVEARGELARVLGASARLIVDLAPETAVFLGEPPALAAMPPRETENRIQLALVLLLQALARPGRPLVVFLDDLQWADAPTLQLLRVLVGDPNSRHLLILGALRDGEVGPDHPLQRVIADLEKGGAVPRRVHLDALSPGDVEHIVADALSSALVEVLPLAALLTVRSGNNPFFLERLLQSLVQEEVIVHDGQAGRWTWDLDKVGAVGVADNVASLMAGQLNRLPAESLGHLQDAACLGAEVDLFMLSTLSGLSPALVAEALAPALDAQMLIPLDGRYRYAAALDEEADPDEIAAAARQIRYRFAHDRVQEAAYASIPTSERAGRHRFVGQRLIELGGGQEHLLSAVTQLNLGRTAIGHPSERLLLAQRNRDAMVLARQQAAFGAALAYAQVGSELVGNTGGALFMALHLGRSELARIAGSVAESQAAIDTARGRARSRDDRLAVVEAQIALYNHSSRFGDSVYACLDALATEFGLVRPQTPEEFAAATVEASRQAEAALAGKRESTLLALPPMSDPAGRAQMRLMGLSAAAATSMPGVFPLQVSRMVTLSATLGTAPESPYAYTNFGFFSAASGDYDRALSFGRLGCALARQSGDLAVVAACEQMMSAFIITWKLSYSEALVINEHAIQAGIEGGDFTSAAYAASNRPSLMVHQGVELSSIIHEIDRAEHLFRTRLRFLDGLGFTATFRYAVLRIMGDEEAIAAHDKQTPGEDKLLGAFDHYPMMLLAFRVVRIIAFVINGDGPAARAEAAIVRPLAPHAPALFYCGDLFLFSLVARTIEPLPVDDPGRAAEDEELAADLAQLEIWGAASPSAHRGRAALARAEMARRRGDWAAAALAYDEAIDGARVAGNLITEVVAAERLGQLYTERGRLSLGRAFFGEARFAAARLGARGAVARLEALAPSAASPTAAGTAPKAASFDVQAVIEATQTIASEVELNSLLSRTLRLLLAHGGAERVALILGEEAEAAVRAEGLAADPKQISLGADPVASRDDLPQEVIRTAYRTGEAVLLVDATRELRYRNTPYVQRTGVRSILAAPLSHQGKILGLVYLENRQAPGAFTPQRVTLVQLIGAQAATSVENAQLYEKLRSHAVILQEKNDQLRELDRMREDFLARTSHELRTPLNGIIGLAQALYDAPLRSGANADNLLSMIINSGRRLSGLINDILDLSTMQRGGLVMRPAACAVGDVVDGVVMLCQPLLGDKSLTIEVNIPVELPLAWADRDRLEQVLLNLVGNAIKFTERGLISVLAAVDGGVLRLSVSDTGRGIPAASIDRIFEPFTQVERAANRDVGGAGIGLSVSREIVRLHGGTLSVQSRVGVGSTFFFDLPIAQEVDLVEEATTRLSRSSPTTALATAAAVEAGPAAASQPMGARILVVDDEPVNLMVLINQLGQAGYVVETAGGGQEALVRMRQSPRPDLMLLDLMMPRIDGITVCETVRKDIPANEMPIIMLTARSQAADVAAGMRAGANDFVTKPFSSVELLARVGAHLRMSAVHRAINLFVPYPFLRLLGRASIADVQLGDSVERDMSVLFCDMRGFTELSEKMGPEENFRFINRYLSTIVPAVGMQGGFVDKYIGDAVLALFESGADSAVRAAVAMHQAISDWNLDRSSEEGPPIRIGIGIHSGRLMLGTVGDPSHLSATVISDTVNLTSRLQDLSKRYGAGIIISEQTRAQLSRPDALRMRIVDEVRVRGRKALVKVYEVFEADPANVRAAKESTCTSFEEAVELFHERAFADAARLFRTCLAMDPHDPATRQYLERCQTISRQMSGEAGW